MSALELTVLIPALNEAASLPTVLRAAKSAAAALTPSFEVLVVDGGSTDGTAERAAEAGARVLRQSQPGFGRAVREGVEAARGTWVLQMDADGSHPATIFRDLWQRREGYELLIASRFMPGGSARMPWPRYALSRLLNAVTRRFLAIPIHDSSSGLKLYRADAVRALELSSADFTVQQEMLARLLAAGRRVAEVPFRYEPRLGGRSKARIPALAFAYLKMLFRLKKLLGGLEPVRALGGVMALGLATGLWGLGWGLPGPQRLRAFPERLLPAPEVARRFADDWRKLYAGIDRAHRELAAEEPVTSVRGVEELEPGWTFPPGKLVNSYRSLLLRSENPDEQKPFAILGRMRPWKLEFQPLYAHYGGGFIYPLGAFLKGASLLGLVELVPDVAHYLERPQDMRRLYLGGRLFMLLLHLGALWLLFDLGMRLRGWKAGFLAAAFFALSPVIVHNSHVVKPYPFTAFCLLAAVRRMLRAAAAGRARDHIFCGLWSGLAFAANLTLGFVVVLPVMAWLARRQPRERGAALAGAALAAAAWAALNPYVLFSYRDFAWEFEVFSKHSFGFDSASLVSFPRAAVSSLGVVLAFLCAAGLLAAFRRGGERRLLLATTLGAGALLFAAFWHGDQTVGAFRLYYPLVALACALAADWLLSLPRSLCAALAIAAVVDSGLRSAVYLENMRRDSGPGATRVAAAEWLERNAPAGSSLGLLRYPEPAHSPFARYDRYRLVVFEAPEALDASRLPDYLAVSALARPSVDNWARKNYDEPATFPPFQAGWARPVDGSFFANTGMHIYRRRTGR